MYNCPRSATVAATQDAVVWVLERGVLRQHIQKGHEDASSQLELFLNQVPILSQLNKEQKLRLLDAFEEQTFTAGKTVIQEGDEGDLFYIIKEGEAVVLQSRSQSFTSSLEEENAKQQISFLNKDDGLGSFEKLESIDIGAGNQVSEKQSSENLDINKKHMLQEDCIRFRRVNQLFKSDFFGEAALLRATPRAATVVAVTDLVCLTLDRENFIKLLGPLESLMIREKSPEVVGARLMRLASKGIPSRQQAMVHIKRKRYSRSRGKWVWELVRAVGHLDEVLAIKTAEMKQREKMHVQIYEALHKEKDRSGLEKSKEENNPRSADHETGTEDGPNDSSFENAADPSVAAANPILHLVEGVILGSGAFSRVSVVNEEGSERSYALKRMRKTAVSHCPEHIFCEQAITRNLTHPFCIRQYGSFQDKYHLYFLFDLMPGGDLMDILVNEASIVTMRTPKSGLQLGCLAPQAKYLKGLPEDVARFYIGSIVLALEYLHQHNIVYRDLKPENVFIDQQGYPKLGDFGFAKVLDSRCRTYTFCGTPGYVAPENILAHGYGTSVDWWGLGVVMYVLLTGKQPFTSPKTDDPMTIMRRIVDQNFALQFPPYISSAARDLITRLLERRPTQRIGCLAGGASDVEKHPWFKDFDFDALAARRMTPPRQPQDDAAKRIRDLATDERKHPHRPPKEKPDELLEANRIFQEF